MENLSILVELSLLFQYFNSMNPLFSEVHCLIEVVKHTSTGRILSLSLIDAKANEEHGTTTKKRTRFSRARIKLQIYTSRYKHTHISSIIQLFIEKHLSACLLKLVFFCQTLTPVVPPFFSCVLYLSQAVIRIFAILLNTSSYSPGV